MPPIRLAAVISALVSAMALGGCRRAPRGILGELPIESIIPSPVPGQEKPGIAQPPTGIPAEWTPKALARPWRWIVIHHSATDSGSAATFDTWHRARGWDELGYHFVINNGRGGTDGAIEVGPRWRKQKWGAHCKTPSNRYNDYGIGICLVGDFNKARPTAAQLKSLRKLVTFLSDCYHIHPASILGHRDAPGTNTACPGTSLAHHIHNELCPYLTRRAQLAKR